MGTKRITLVVAALLAMPLAANADTIAFSDLAPSYPQGAGNFSNDTWGFEFTSAATGNLSNLSLALIDTGSTALSANIGIFRDQNGEVGTTLEQWSNVSVSATQASQLTSLTPSSGISIVAGSSYWVLLTANEVSSPTVDWWSASSAPTTAEVTYYAGPGTGSYFTSSTPGAFSVSVSAVPLPASVWLMLSGLAGAGLIRKRRACRARVLR